MAVLVQLRPPVDPAIQTASEAARNQAPSVLHFADGSRALAAPGAVLEVEREDRDRVVVRQKGGTARYDVAPRADREFTVWAGKVRVRVLGTAFRVAYGDQRVSVEVTRGRVQVWDGIRARELGTGSSLEISARGGVDAIKGLRLQTGGKSSAPAKQ